MHQAISSLTQIQTEVMLDALCRKNTKHFTVMEVEPCCIWFVENSQMICSEARLFDEQNKPDMC